MYVCMYVCMYVGMKCISFYFKTLITKHNCYRKFILCIKRRSKIKQQDIYILQNPTFQEK